MRFYVLDLRNRDSVDWDCALMHRQEKGTIDQYESLIGEEEQTFRAKPSVCDSRN